MYDQIEVTSTVIKTASTNNGQTQQDDSLSCTHGNFVNKPAVQPTGAFITNAPFKADSFDSMSFVDAERAGPRFLCVAPVRQAMGRSFNGLLAALDPREFVVGDSAPEGITVTCETTGLETTHQVMIDPGFALPKMPNQLQAYAGEKAMSIADCVLSHSPDGNEKWAVVRVG